MSSSFLQSFPRSTLFHSEIYLSTQGIFFPESQQKKLRHAATQIKHIDTGELKKAHKEMRAKNLF